MAGPKQGTTTVTNTAETIGRTKQAYDHGHRYSRNNWHDKPRVRQRPPIRQKQTHQVSYVSYGGMDMRHKHCEAKPWSTSLPQPRRVYTAFIAKQLGRIKKRQENVLKTASVLMENTLGSYLLAGIDVWATNGDEDYGKYWRAGNALHRRWKNNQKRSFQCCRVWSFLQRKSSHRPALLLRKMKEERHSEMGTCVFLSRTCFQADHNGGGRKKDSRTHLGHSRHGQEEQGEEDELQAQKKNTTWGGT